MPEDNPESRSADDGRIPRLAIGVVIAGLVVSALIYALSFVPGSGSLEIDWDTSEPIASPSAKPVGSGTFSLSRTSLSAIAPNEDGLLLYRVAGVARIDSAGRQATRIRCSVRSGVAGETRLARASRLRAAWPRSSSGVGVDRQAVPETSTVKFRTDESKKIDLPIRDVVQRYVDTNAWVTVEWDGYVEDEQTWFWRLPDGSGAGTTTLPWLVIFESETRPRGVIDCEAGIGADEAGFRIPFLQEEWPITDDEPNTGEVDTGDVSNVE